MILYLDCDTGIDDALALGYLLGRDDVTLAGIGTVDGNTSARQAAANTLGLLHLAGREEIPVASGAGDARSAGQVHGGNGVGGLVLPAGPAPDPRTPVQLIRDLAARHPGELHLLATGPCSNLAEALREDPGVADLVASVTLMGGAVRVRGNVSPRAEANVAGDPAAVATVLAAPWPVTLVPLDVTMSNRWTEADRDRLAASGNPLNEALAAMLPVYFDWYEPKFGAREIPLHDPLAAGVAIGSLVPSDAPVLGLRVDLAHGALVEDPQATTRARVVLDLEKPAGPEILRVLLGVEG